MSSTHPNYLSILHFPIVHILKDPTKYGGRSDMHETTIQDFPRLSRALLVVNKILFDGSGLDAMIDVVEKSMRFNRAIPSWTRDQARQHVYNFLNPAMGLEPKIAVDETKEGVYNLAHHSRASNYNPVAGRLIILNAQQIHDVEAMPEELCLPGMFRIVHILTHEIAHVLLSYCFAVAAPVQVPPGTLMLPEPQHTPPEVGYLDRYSNSTTEGESGFWLEKAIFGGAVFYKDHTTTTDGHPCIYSAEDNNEWIELDYGKLSQLIFPEAFDNVHLTLPFRIHSSDGVRFWNQDRSQPQNLNSIKLDEINENLVIWVVRYNPKLIVRG
ncbi:hypothetical protein ABW19_dt0200904 [Dactylella cylindrospora]|nr:hypothetical protein ABW19_dt0200904 [Dactylella cylindrospora]